MSYANLDCFIDFPWDSTCGKTSPTGIWFYPQYDEGTCYEKALGEFDMYDTDKYSDKNACCMYKFSNNVMACCEDGDGACISVGTPVYIPNWSDQKCDERDSTLVTAWEAHWVSDTIEECCEECK